MLHRRLCPPPLLPSSAPCSLAGSPPLCLHACYLCLLIPYPISLSHPAKLPPSSLALNLLTLNQSQSNPMPPAALSAILECRPSPPDPPSPLVLLPWTDSSASTSHHHPHFAHSPLCTPSALCPRPPLTFLSQHVLSCAPQFFESSTSPSPRESVITSCASKRWTLASRQSHTTRGQYATRRDIDQEEHAACPRSPVRLPPPGAAPQAPAPPPPPAAAWAAPPPRAPPAQRWRRRGAPGRPAPRHAHIASHRGAASGARTDECVVFQAGLPPTGWLHLAAQFVRPSSVAPPPPPPLYPYPPHPTCSNV